jgi:hypothetical protein
MVQLREKQKGLLTEAYQYYMQQKQAPWTPRDILSLRPLLNQHLIEPIKYFENGKAYLRFQITVAGISYLRSIGALSSL